MLFICHLSQQIGLIMSRTFREQGVEENEHCCLDGSSFYSDQNVDSRDLVQLNLLWGPGTVSNAQTPEVGELSPQNSGCGWWRQQLGSLVSPRLRRSLSIMLSYGAGWRPLWAASHPGRGGFGWLPSGGSGSHCSLSLSPGCRNCWLTIHVLLLSYLTSRKQGWILVRKSVFLINLKIFSQ